MQSAGSSTDGLATKVLWRMLMTGRALQRKQISVLPAWHVPGQARGSGLRGAGAEGGRSGAPRRQGWRWSYPPSPWLTAAARCGLTGSPPAGPGRSSHPRPSARSVSSRRWPSRAVPAPPRGLPGDRGEQWGQAQGELWGAGPRGNRERAGEGKEGKPPLSLSTCTCCGRPRSPRELLW